MSQPSSWWETNIKGWRTRASFGNSSLLLGTNPNPQINQSPGWKKRGTEGNVFLGEAQAAPLEHRPWAGAGCGAAEEAAGSVFPGLSSGHLCPGRTRAHCVRGPAAAVAPRDARGQRGSTRSPCSSGTFLSLLPPGNLGKQNPCASSAAPQAVTSVTQRSGTTGTLQSIPRRTEVMISLCTSQGSSVLLDKKSASQSPLFHDTASAGMELTTKSRAYSNHHRAGSQSSLYMVIQSSRTSKKSKIWHIRQVTALFWSGVSLEPLTLNAMWNCIHLKLLKFKRIVM